MANIKRIDGKSGPAFKITVTSGRGADGKQKRHYKTWRPAPGMTEKRMEKEVQKAAFEFEQQIEQGYVADNRQSFAQYAEYVIDLKERNGELWFQAGGGIVAKSDVEYELQEVNNKLGALKKAIEKAAIL